MAYQNCGETVQGDHRPGLNNARHLADANINPKTGLATDYLNHFNEAIMLLEMLPTCLDCRTDFLRWRAKSYCEHFADSRSHRGDVAIAAYAAADPNARDSLDALAGTMTAVLEATRQAMTADMPSHTAWTLAERAAASLKPLVARAGAVINGVAGQGQPPSPQALVDALMRG